MRGAEVEVVLAEGREADTGAAEGVDHRLAAEDASEERPSREVAAEDEERPGSPLFRPSTTVFSRATPPRSPCRSTTGAISWASVT